MGVGGDYRWDVASVEAHFEKAIEALDAVAHAQGQPAPRWRSVAVPMTAGESTEQAGHLAFSVSVERLIGLPGMGENGDGVTVSGPLVVVFGYRIRLGAEKADYRLATLAAKQILATLLARCPGVQVIPDLAVFAPGPVRDGWMAVAVSITVQFDQTT